MEKLSMNIKEELEAFKPIVEKDTNKAEVRRARVNSVELGKLLKKFRGISVK